LRGHGQLVAAITSTIKSTTFVHVAVAVAVHVHDHVDDHDHVDVSRETT
jgi:hypothetical protein